MIELQSAKLAETTTMMQLLQGKQAYNLCCEKAHQTQLQRGKHMHNRKYASQRT